MEDNKSENDKKNEKVDEKNEKVDVVKEELVDNDDKSESNSKEEIVIQDISKTDSEIAILEEVINEEENKEENFNKEELEINDDLFITEKDRFTINITYYFDKSLKEPFILGYDDGYFYEKDDEKRSEEKTFTVTFKYPNQQDTELIMSSKPIQSLDEANFSDFITLENIRIGTLIREWSIKKPLNNISKMHPKIIKAIRLQLTSFIGSNGFF
jgi:hypothetical protein